MVKSGNFGEEAPGADGEMCLAWAITSKRRKKLIRCLAQRVGDISSKLIAVM